MKDLPHPVEEETRSNMQQEMEWVAELPTSRRPHGRGKAQQFIANLKSKPGTWAVYKRVPRSKYKHGWTGKTTYEKHYKGTEWTSRVQSGKVVIYARWTGKKAQVSK